MTVEGNPASAVRVIAYGDLQCSDCAAYRRMLDEHLLPRYGDRVGFEDREFPLPKHLWARDAAIGALRFASISQQLGVAFRRYCFTNHEEITKDNIATHVHAFAELHGIEPEFDSAPLAAQVDADYAEGLEQGVTRTPTIFVGAMALVERFSLDEISSCIDKAIDGSTKSND